MLVRTWNLFHGNTSPPGRETFLDEMVRLAVADQPAVVCLQELPVWALGRLAEWSGRTAVGVVGQPPSLGPFPATAEVGRVLTALNPGVLRSAFAGQANAVLLGPGLVLVEQRHVALNPFRFRRAQAHRLGLGLVARLAWGKERRVCQAIRVRREAQTFVIGNLHATSYRPDKRVADAELLRAAVFVDGFALPHEPVLLGGDFNISVRRSRTLAELMTSDWGFGGATPTGIDHVLVRGAYAGDAHAWPAERRTRDGRLLSDHAPVDVEVEMA
ncbi:MAG: endonuclease/exonuclease/phosphatase family protein [Gaiellaceae bacterium]